MAAVNNDSINVTEIRSSRYEFYKLVNLLGQHGLNLSLYRCVLKLRY